MATIWLKICVAVPDTTLPFIVTVRTSSPGFEGVSGAGARVGFGVLFSSLGVWEFAVEFCPFGEGVFGFELLPLFDELR